MLYPQNGSMANGSRRSDWLTSSAAAVVSDAGIVSGIWNSTLATGLILVGLVVGLVVLLLGRFRKSIRTVGAFIGGEVLDERTGRISGTHFYDTVRSTPGLRKIYGAQETGNLDPYRWIGGLGLGVTGLLKKIHNGLLPWYLSWILVGIVVLLVVFLFRM